MSDAVISSEHRRNSSQSNKKTIRELGMQIQQNEQEIQVSPRRRPGFQSIVQLESMITCRNSSHRRFDAFCSGRPSELERGT